MTTPNAASRLFEEGRAQTRCDGRMFHVQERSTGDVLVLCQLHARDFHRGANVARWHVYAITGPSEPCAHTAETSDGTSGQTGASGDLEVSS